MVQSVYHKLLALTINPGANVAVGLDEYPHPAVKHWPYRASLVGSCYRPRSTFTAFLVAILARGQRVEEEQ